MLTCFKFYKSECSKFEFVWDVIGVECCLISFKTMQLISNVGRITECFYLLFFYLIVCRKISRSYLGYKVIYSVVWDHRLLLKCAYNHL